MVIEVKRKPSLRLLVIISVRRLLPFVSCPDVCGAASQATVLSFQISYFLLVTFWRLPSFAVPPLGILTQIVVGLS